MYAYVDAVDVDLDYEVQIQSCRWRCGDEDVVMEMCWWRCLVGDV